MLIRKCLWIIPIVFVSYSTCAVSNVDTEVSSAVKIEDQAFVKEHTSFETYIETLKQEALRSGISSDVVEQAFHQASYLKQVVNLDKNQPEKRDYLESYLARVLTPIRINDAKNNYRLYRQQLHIISKKYGVPAKYIVALWGTESNFGRIQGKENIISALATLAFDGRREAFFKTQLFTLLELLDQGKISFKHLRGSWAGAMGQCQFMPSSLKQYGVDEDGDGIIDIWNNHNDVFASIANYLKTEGWDRSQRWGREVTLSKAIDPALLGIDLDKKKTISEWIALGVKFPPTVKLTSRRVLQQDAWLIIPDDPTQRAFLVYRNFRTLMHWNRSYYFAISVGTLADKIME